MSAFLVLHILPWLGIAAVIAAVVAVACYFEAQQKPDDR